MRRRPSARTRANRRNAQSSTGPRTAAGKAKAAQNARLHGLRAKADPFGPTAAKIAAILAGEVASDDIRAAARAFAEGQTIVLRARRLQASAWSVFRDNHPADMSLQEVLDDPVLGDPVVADIFDPVGRAHIRGDAPVDDEELRLVLRIRAYAIRIRRQSADDLIRRLRLLSRYEGRGLQLRRQAEAELRKLRAAGEAVAPARRGAGRSHHLGAAVVAPSRSSGPHRGAATPNRCSRRPPAAPLWCKVKIKLGDQQSAACARTKPMTRKSRKIKPIETHSFFADASTMGSTRPSGGRRHCPTGRRDIKAGATDSEGEDGTVRLSDVYNRT